MSDPSGIPVTRVKGVGEKTAKLFDALGIQSVEELLYYLPRAYERFVQPVNAAEVRDGVRCAVRVRLLRTPALKYAGNYKILTGEASDSTGTIRVTWFNQPYLKKTLFPGREYVFRGLARKKGNSLVLEQPAIYSPEDYESMADKMLPRYRLVKGLKNNTVMKAVREAMPYAGDAADPIPESVAAKRKLMPLADSLSAVHFPNGDDELSLARRKLIYNEFFLFIAGTRYFRESTHGAEKGIEFKYPDCADRLIGALPYELTGAQKRVLSEIRRDMTGGVRMHRLVQGDVGSGKTILALISMLIAASGGYQAALMAPTQVLATQHFETFSGIIEKYGLNLRPVLLSGNMTAKEKREANEAIASGAADLIIGTNALMQEKVSYHALGLVITDEQHRFGVRQRELLAGKGEAPHILVMSATPIPRTLGMILYGDLDISVLDELPSGRKSIKNAIVGPSLRQRSWKFIADEVKKGRQAYVICPMIERNEDEDGDDPDGMECVTEYAEKLRGVYPSDIRIGILHGKMSSEKKDEVMSEMAGGRIDVLVSTTVVEVGINVPNATVMMIENAERFGLAQLHQLRGRVGRGEHQSYCIFVNTSDGEAAAERLAVLKETNDGFKIADEDLKLRGPGDLFGVRQSGEFSFRIGDIYSDSDLLKLAAADVDEIFAVDPSLERAESKNLKRVLENGGLLDHDTL
ncbi:MAG: ATP-dependent DNA helicase RecG [Lachnospiraceae bacterium]|nr:ATP-dependent DNA helicase RecG [Lachnospiraceae bacterium]